MRRVSRLSFRIRLCLRAWIHSCQFSLSYPALGSYSEFSVDTSMFVGYQGSVLGLMVAKRCAPVDVMPGLVVYGKDSLGITIT